MKTKRKQSKKKASEPRTLDLFRDFDAELRRGATNARHDPPKSTRRVIWPQYSDNLGCHPSQIDEMKAAYAKKGVAVDFTPDGRMIWTGYRHRQLCIRAGECHDRSGYY